MNPKPSEVLGVEGQEEPAVAGEEKYTSDEWMSWMWEIQVGAVQNPSIQCWVCGQMGHMGRNCPSKGKGEGSVVGGKGGGVPLTRLGAKELGSNPRS
eukprot:2965480-Karenia_brevis.AAC.1